jgi:hypothetical protein
MRPRIGRLIPATIAIALLLDAATRLIPIDLFTFRAWEALVVAHAPTGPFEPNRVYVNPLSYGDLARSPPVPRASPAAVRILLDRRVGVSQHGAAIRPADFLGSCSATRSA